MYSKIECKKFSRRLLLDVHTCSKAIWDFLFYSGFLFQVLYLEIKLEKVRNSPALDQTLEIYSGLSSECWARQAQREVVKIKNLDFSYWAWSTPWGHVLSLKKFCRNPALSWAISYSVFQPVTFTSSFEFVCGTLFSTFWRLILKFGYIRWF